MLPSTKTLLLLILNVFLHNNEVTTAWHELWNRKTRHETHILRVYIFWLKGIKE